jgi:predicted transcriptional regulator of viral defense system
MPIYITDAERTLIDSLRKPEKSGGMAKVFQAWRKAESMNVDRLVGYVNRYDVQNLRQRVGYLLERLGQSHFRLEQWKDRLQRGGSVKLVPSKPYEATFSAQWNLSLNLAPSVLAIIDGAINAEE